MDVVAALAAAGERLRARFSPEAQLVSREEIVAAIHANDVASLDALRGPLSRARPSAGWELAETARVASIIINATPGDTSVERIEDLGDIRTARGPDALVLLVPALIRKRGVAPFAVTIAR